MPFIMYDPSEATHDRETVNVLCEGRVFTFQPYKPVQISDAQWRYMANKGADSIGLGIFDTNEDLVAEVLESRVETIKKRAEAVDVDGDGEISIYEQALVIEKWSELRTFARQYLDKLPRSRGAVMAALKDLG